MQRCPPRLGSFNSSTNSGIADFKIIICNVIFESFTVVSCTAHRLRAHVCDKRHNEKFFNLNAQLPVATVIFQQYYSASWVEVKSFLTSFLVLLLLNISSHKWQLRPGVFIVSLSYTIGSCSNFLVILYVYVFALPTVQRPSYILTRNSEERFWPR